jgi:cobalt-zinc-cadmium efflux system membrane fusion protein
MYLTANISTQNKKGLAVPKLAILNYEKKDFIYLVKDATHFEMHEVKLGLEEGDWLQITSASGLDLTNKQLVVKNAYTILGKMANTGD